MTFEEWTKSDNEESNYYKWHVSSYNDCVFPEEVAKLVFEAGKKEGMNEARKLVAEYIART